MAQRIALVTGGMGGLGEAICIKLEKMGIKVVVTYSPGNTKHADDSALFEGRRDVATPRRAGPSVAGGGDDDIHPSREVVELAAHRVEQLARADRQLAHRLLHDDLLQLEALAEKQADRAEDFDRRRTRRRRDGSGFQRRTARQATA